MAKKQKFKRVLIANRGEIAVRVARTLREMNIAPIAVYSEVDRGAPHVRAADFAVCVGPAPALESYLLPEKILEAAQRTDADAIHPGYGFLSENADFAEMIESSGLAFIGPPASAIRAMGSKTEARDRMKKAGVPLVPGSDGPVSSPKQAQRVAAKLGYPVMLKASAGGGGKGLRRVNHEREIEGAFRAAASEAKNAFGDDTVYVEKVIVKPKHIEIQVLSGPDGKAVFVGERECSMQRRHQKVIEESPSPVLSESVRQEMGQVACRAADAVGYVGAGTVEFLFDGDRFYFLEMNTRLQVEHPVTEMCFGLDLVAAQVRIAQGEPLSYAQTDLVSRGHAIEARLYAEDPDQGFMPSPGHIEAWVSPEGPGIRVDAGVSSGSDVSQYYDPMIAKIIAWGEDRSQARQRLRRALEQTAVKGLKSNGGYLRALLEHPEFVDGTYHTDSAAHGPNVVAPTPLHEDAALAAMVLQRFWDDKRQAAQLRQTGSSMSQWRQPVWRSARS